MNKDAMKLLIVEDDKEECMTLVKCAEKREDINIVAVTDSDIEAIHYLKVKHPEGIILDLELNNSSSGNSNSLEFISKIKELKLNYEPIIIVTTHVNSKRTYDILHRNGVDIILYKDHPTYSSDYVFNSFIHLRKPINKKNSFSIDEEIKKKENKTLEIINSEMDLIGVIPKFKGREYLCDAILYLIENENTNRDVISYVASKHDKSESTIATGMKKVILHAWKTTPIEDLEKYYKNRVSYETGVPTPMEFVYYYVKKVKEEM